MKDLVTLLKEMVFSFVIGGLVMFVIILCQSVKRIIKTGEAFTLAVSGIGVSANEWNILTGHEVFMICLAGAVGLLIIDLVYTIIKLLLRRH